MNVELDLLLQVPTKSVKDACAATQLAPSSNAATEASMIMRAGRSSDRKGPVDWVGGGRGAVVVGRLCNCRGSSGRGAARRQEWSSRDLTGIIAAASGRRWSSHGQATQACITARYKLSILPGAVGLGSTAPNIEPSTWPPRQHTTQHPSSSWQL